MKKICFVTHEFGLFQGHGGCSTYLQVLIEQILERHTDYQVFVITLGFDKNNILLKNPRLKCYELTPKELHLIGLDVLSYLKNIKPDFVECVDYQSFCLESICYRNSSDINELTNTKFITVHHTATRECFEWNEEVPVRFAYPFEQVAFEREKTQLKLSDATVAPSDFMNFYVTKNYNLENVKTIHHPILFSPITKDELKESVGKFVDLSIYEGKFVVSCISRIEGRKNQKLLINAFINFLNKTGIDAKLFIIGNSSYNSVTSTPFVNEYFETIPEKYVKNILFFDFMNSEQKKQIFAISDLFVLPSTFECLSFATMEAVAYGVPVITSKYCGFSDYMGNTKEYMTFNPFDVDTLEKAIFDFYNFTKGQRLSVLNEQVKNVLKVGSLENCVDERLYFYEKIERKCSLEHNILFVTPDNFENQITEDILLQKYNSIFVSFNSSNNFNNNTCNFINRFANYFKKNEILCTSNNIVYKSYEDILCSFECFYIPDVKITEEHLSMTFYNLISSFITKNTSIYNICGNIEKSQLINDECKNFQKKLMANIFYNRFKINLEERI